MPRKPDNAIPAYRHHRASGNAVVTIQGKDYYLGSHGTKASKQEYDRLIAEWVGNGRAIAPSNRSKSSTGTKVKQLILSFMKHAKTYYRKNGVATSELSTLSCALGPVRRLYRTTTSTRWRSMCRDRYGQ